MRLFKNSFLFLFTCLSVTAQTRYLEWVNPKTTLRERIDISSAVRIMENEKGDWKEIGKVEITSDLTNDWQTFQEKNTYFNFKQNAVWFTINGSQRIYQFDYSTNKLHRIDDTHYAGYNFNATQFLRKDTLYSAGGYGFWKYNNLLTYYNEVKREWDLIRTQGEAPLSILGGYQGYDAEHNLFYSGGSETESNTPEIKKSFVEDLFVFDFKNSSWQKVGKINPVLDISNQREIYWTGRFFLTWAVNQLFIVDPVLNKIYVYTSNYERFSKTGKYYTKEDTLISFFDSPSSISKFSIREIVSKSKEIGPFYITNPYQTIFIWIILGIIILGACWYSYYRWNRKRNSSNSLFNEQELRLIEAFCRLKEGEYLSANDITDMLDLQIKSVENQRKIRMNMINSMSDKFEQKLKISNAIIRLDDPTDKRIKMFCLSEKAIHAINSNKY